MRASEWLIGAALLLAFSPALISMAKVWASVDYTSHGFLVPAVAVWIAWQQARLMPLRSPGSPGPGLALCSLALLLYALGLGGGGTALQGLAFVIAVAGAVASLRGTAGLRTLAFPIGFLLFMVPLPEDWITPLVVQLQLAVSSLSVDLLHAFGVPVARNGNVLLIPGGERLFVDEACSGITSIVTLTPLSVLLAYYAAEGWWRRALLVAAVTPIAMFWNGVRVVATVLFATWFGAQQATEPSLHELAGILTFVAACLVLIGIGAVLRRPLRAA